MANSDLDIIIQSLSDPSIILTDEQKALKAEFINSFDFTSKDIAFSKTVTLENGVSGQVNIHMDGSTSVQINNYGMMNPKMNAAERMQARNEIASQFRESSDVQEVTENLKKDYTEFKNDILSQSVSEPLHESPIDIGTNTISESAPVQDIPAQDTPTIETASSESPEIATPTQQTVTPEAPTVEAPTVETPTVETPTVETPTVETPTVETPTAETPTVDTPTVDTPTVDTPTVDTPTVDTPTMDYSVSEPFSSNLSPVESMNKIGSSTIELKYDHHVQIGKIQNPQSALWSETITTPEGITGTVSIDASGTINYQYTSFPDQGLSFETTGDLINSRSNLELAFRSNPQVIEAQTLFQQNYGDLQNLYNLNPTENMNLPQYLSTSQGKTFFNSYNEIIGNPAFETLHPELSGVSYGLPENPAVDFFKGVKDFLTSPAGIAVVSSVAVLAAILLWRKHLEKRNARVTYYAPEREMEHSPIMEEKNKEKESLEHDNSEQIETPVSALKDKAEEITKEEQDKKQHQTEDKKLEKEEVDTSKTEETILEQKDEKEHDPVHATKERVSSIDKSHILQFEDDNFELDEKNGVIIFHNVVQRGDVNRALQAAIESGMTYSSIVFDADTTRITSDAFMQYESLTKGSKIKIENIDVKDGRKLKITTGKFKNAAGYEVHPFRALKDTKVLVMEKGIPKTTDGNSLAALAEGKTSVLCLVDVEKVPEYFASRSNLGAVITINSKDDLVTDFGKGCFKTGKSVYDEAEELSFEGALLRDKDHPAINAVTNEDLLNLQKTFNYSRDMDIEKESVNLSGVNQEHIKNILLGEMITNGEYKKFADLWIENKKSERNKFRMNSSYLMGETSRFKNYQPDGTEEKQKLYEEKRNEYNRQIDALFEEAHRDEIIKEFENSDEFKKELEERLKKNKNANREAQKNENAQARIEKINNFKQKIITRLNPEQIIEANKKGRMQLDIENLSKSNIGKDAFLNTKLSFGETEEYKKALNHALDKRNRLESYFRDEPVAMEEKDIQKIRDLNNIFTSPNSKRDLTDIEIKNTLEKNIPYSLKKRLEEVPNGKTALIDYLTNEVKLASLEDHTAFITGYNTRHGTRCMMNSGLTGIVQDDGIRSIEIEKNKLETTISELKAKKEEQKKAGKDTESIDKKIKAAEQKLDKLGKDKDGNPILLSPEFKKGAFGYNDILVSTAYTTNDKEAYIGNKKGNVLKKIESENSIENTYKYASLKEQEQQDKKKIDMAKLLESFVEQYKKMSIPKALFNIMMLPIIGAITISTLRTSKDGIKETKETKAKRAKELESALKDEGVVLEYVKDEGIKIKPATKKDLEDMSVENKKVLELIGEQYNAKDAKYATKETSLKDFLKSSQAWMNTERYTIPLLPNSTEPPTQEKSELAKKITSNCFSIQVPRNTTFTIEKADGSKESVNANDGIDHGEGDWLVCDKDAKGKPDFSSLSVVNGLQFKDYFRTGFRVTNKENLNLLQNQGKPDKSVEKGGR